MKAYSNVVTHSFSLCGLYNFRLAAAAAAEHCAQPPPPKIYSAKPK